MKRFSGIFFASLFLVLSCIFPISGNAIYAEVGVSYEGHVQNVGWQSAVSDGEIAGTVGKALRLEALEVSITNAPAGADIQYSAFVSGTGWQAWVNDGATIGTTNKAKAIEALRFSLIELPGYSVEYQVHLATLGWQSWVRDGQIAGYEGAGIRIEAVRIRIVKISDNTDVGVEYASHIKNIGWQAPSVNGNVSGTEGKALRIEALKLKLVNAPAGADIHYQVHVANIGWMSSVANDEIAGTTGRALQVEAVRIWLGDIVGYSVQYQVHIANLGWSAWVSDGATAGTVNRALRLEAIRVRIVKNDVLTVTVTAEGEALSVVKDETLQMIATVTPVNANNFVEWSVAPVEGAGAGEATIDEDGLLTGTANGNVVVTATADNGITGEMTVAVVTGKQPILSAIHVSSNNEDSTKAMNGDIITLTFTSDEPVTKLSNFKINGSNPDTFTNVGLVYKATHLVDSGDAINGEPISFQINVKNAKDVYSQTIETTSDASAVTIIAKYPIISAVHVSSNNADPTKALRGDIITLTFTSDEPVTKLSNFKINSSNPDTFTNVGLVYTATHLVDSGDAVSGEPISFQINVKNAANIYSKTIETSSDGSSVTVIDTLHVSNETQFLAAVANVNVAHIILDNNIMLSANTSITHTVTIDGQGFYFSKALLIDAANVEIDDVTIKTSFFYNDGGDWYFAVMVGDYAGFKLTNSTITGVAYQDAVGISDKTSNTISTITVENVDFSTLWVGILTDSMTTVVNAKDSSFDTFKHGIYLAGDPVLPNTITGNSFTGLVGTNYPDAISVSSTTLQTVIDAMRASNNFNEIVYPADIRVRDVVE